MTQEERDIIVSFIARVGGAAAPGGFAQGAVAGSVPATAPPLPPVDPAADALIGELFARYPEARYRITQLAFVQEHALAEAQNRIKKLEWDVQQAQQAAQQAIQQAQEAAAQAAAQPARSGGFLGGLFGGSQPRPAQPAPQGVWGQGPGGPSQGGPYPGAPYPGAAPGGYAPPPPQYAPGYQPGMFQRGGSGFLGSALTTAAGVAGGLVVGNALMDLFSPHRAEAATSGFMPGSAAASPWGGASPIPDAIPEPPQPPADGYVDQGAWTTPDPAAPNADNAWAQPDNSGWADNSGGGDWGSDPGSDPGGADDDNSLI